MPFALKRASGHVGSKGSSFDSWALLGGCFVHHVFLADSNRIDAGRRQVEEDWLAGDRLCGRLGLAVECGGEVGRVRGE